MISAFDRVENIVGKGKMQVTSIFFFSHNVFKRLLSWYHEKSGLCCKEHRNLTFHSESIWSDVKKCSLLHIKKNEECNASIILRYTKMPYPPKITNEKKRDHNFIFPSDRQHKNVPVKIVNPLGNAFLT